VTAHLARRLVKSLITVVGAAIIVFAILRLAPGDPAQLLLGETATEQAIRALRQRLGLDQPVMVQLGKFLWGLLHGDFGESLSYQRPTLDLIVQAFPATVTLSAAAFLISLVVAVPIGIASATRRGSLLDHATVTGVLVSQAMPTFWIGIMLIFIFAVALRWLPTSGVGTWRHLVLPAVTLATFQLAMLTRIVRSGMLEVLGEDYIRTARAKGLAPRRVLVRHAFRNTLIPVVTILALQLGSLLAGAVITEAVFAWPGIGSLAIRALLARDYPLVQALVLFSSAVIVGLNFLADTAYAILDPRIR